MRIAVAGAGAMGAAVARLLGRHEDVELVVLDADEGRLRSVADELDRAETRIGPASRELLSDTDAVASCVPYRLNLEVMEAALAAGVPYADLGGLYHMTLRQLELNGRFREAGVAAILGVGCCPGISNLMARLAADRLDVVDSIDLVDGAIEEDDSFGVPYSADTILDEFTAPAMVFEEGALREVPAASGAIRWPFPEPLGEMEAVYTLHSELATLPRTIDGVREVRWRLALPPAVAEGFRVLTGLGLASDEPVETPSGSVVPRELLRTMLARLPKPEGPPRDVEILQARVAGSIGGRRATFIATATFRPTPEGISAGAFGTAIPMATAVRWLAGGRVTSGVHPPETGLEAEPFLSELAGEGVELTVTVEEELGP